MYLYLITSKLVSVYPDNCESFYGPHAVDCIENIWNESDCIKEGHRFLRLQDESELKNKSLVLVSALCLLSTVNLIKSSKMRFWLPCSVT